MMLPSALPMLLIYQQMLRKRMPAPQRHLALLLFCSAYVLVWAGFALGATALQWALERLALLSPGMHSSSTALAAGLLLVAGIYQWLPSKAVCLEHCRGPLHFLLRSDEHTSELQSLMRISYAVFCLTKNTTTIKHKSYATNDDYYTIYINT